MATTKQRLALSIINFLNNSLTDGTLSEEDRESVEVAQNCISDAFKIDPTDNTLKDSQTLLQIYMVYERLKNQAPASSSSTAAAATSFASSTVNSTPDSSSTVSSSESQKEQADALKSQGNAAMTQKDYATAIDLYTQALKIMPGDPIFLSNRAAAYSASKDHESACADAEAAVAVKPTYTKAWSRLGLARFALGNIQGSKEAYAKGIEYEGNGGSEAMKKGLETASKRLAELESGGKDNTNDSNYGNDRAPLGSGTGGMPDLSSLAGMLGGGSGRGMPDLSSIMSNPMFASMAQNLMSNPEMLNNLMSNPRLAELANQFGAGGGQDGRMPDLSSLMQNPNIADLAQKFLGGGGRGQGRGAGQ